MLPPWLQGVDTLGAIRAGSALGMQERQQRLAEEEAAAQAARAQAAFAYQAAQGARADASAAQELGLKRDQLFQQNLRHATDSQLERESAAARLKQAEAQMQALGDYRTAQIGNQKDAIAARERQHKETLAAGAAKQNESNKFKLQNQKLSLEDSKALRVAELSLLGLSDLESKVQKSPGLFGIGFTPKTWLANQNAPLVDPRRVALDQAYSQALFGRAFELGGKALTKTELDAVIRQVGSPSSKKFAQQLEGYRQATANTLDVTVNRLREEGYGEGKFAKHLDKLEKLAAAAHEGPLTKDQFMSFRKLSDDLDKADGEPSSAADQLSMKNSGRSATAAPQAISPGIIPIATPGGGEIPVLTTQAEVDAFTGPAYDWKRKGNRFKKKGSNAR